MCSPLIAKVSKSTTVALFNSFMTTSYVRTPYSLVDTREDLHQVPLAINNPINDVDTKFLNINYKKSMSLNDVS